MRKNRPRCPLCDGPSYKHGTTTAGTPRWRCPRCPYTFTRPNQEAIEAFRFRIFIAWLTQGIPLHHYARQHKVSTRTLQRWFEPFWAIQVPQVEDQERIYDQVFIDGTYFNTKCLLIASTGTNEVIAWHWCYTEDSFNYRRLFDKLLPPVVVTTDGQSGALKAIKQHWPTTHIQRCLIHVYRNIRQTMGQNPYLPANIALKKLGQQLLKITTAEQAAQWAVALHNFHTQFGDWLNQRTYVKDVPFDQIPRAKRRNKVFWHTHYQQRRMYNTLESLYKDGHLFTYLTCTDTVGDEQLKHHTNSLEGAANKEIKKLLRTHAGLRDERQRIACDWWLYLHTKMPDDPVQIARQQRWGQVPLAKVKELTNQEKQAAHGHDDGRPPVYDDGIESTPTNSMGIRKGWLGR